MAVAAVAAARISSLRAIACRPTSYGSKFPVPPAPWLFSWTIPLHSAVNSESVSGWSWYTTDMVDLNVTVNVPLSGICSRQAQTQLCQCRAQVHEQVKLLSWSIK